MIKESRVFFMAENKRSVVVSNVVHKLEDRVHVRFACEL